MIWYYYLNYRIYKFYQRKRDSMPVLFSFLGSMLLLFMNVFSFLLIVDFLKPFLFLVNKYYVFVLMLVLAVINYFVLYRGEHYLNVFDNFDNSSDNYKSWNKYVPLYIIGSILIMLIVLGIADYRHDGHL